MPIFSSKYKDRVDGQPQNVSAVDDRVFWLIFCSFSCIHIHEMNNVCNYRHNVSAGALYNI